jgi:archaellum biogenesis ATPase FlaH
MSLAKPSYQTRRHGRITEIISKSCQMNEPKYIKQLVMKGEQVMLPSHYECAKFIMDYHKTHGKMPNEDVFLDNPDFTDFYAKDTSTTDLSYDYVQYYNEGALRVITNKINDMKSNVNSGLIQPFEELINLTRHLKLDEKEPPVDVFDTEWDYIFDPQTKDGILTGLPVLDKAIFGLKRGEVFTTVGDTNVGKSWFMAFFAACQLLKGRFVVFVTGEMTKEDTMSRIMGFITNINPKILRDGSNHTKLLDAKASYSNAMKTLKDRGAKLVILNGESYSADSLKNEIDGLEEKYDGVVDFVIVDGVYLMATNDGRSGQDWTIQASIAYEYTMEARNSKWRLMLSTQLTRGKSGDLNVTTSDIGKAYAYAETATAVMVIASDNDGLATPVLSSSGKPFPIRACKIIKNRVGDVGDIGYVVQRYDDMTWLDYDISPSGVDLVIRAASL